MWQLHLPKCRPPFLQPPGDINLLTSVNNRQAHGSKREVAKTPPVSLLLSNLLLCCDFVHVYAIKLAKWTSKRCKKMWDWGDGSSQTCCQRNTNSTTVIAMIVNATEAHACAPITNRNANRDIKNKEIQMVNPSARKFSRPSVFIAHTCLHQVTRPVLNHHTNDAVMVCPTGMIPASVILKKKIEIVFVHYLCPDWAYHLNTYDIMI